MADDGLPTGLKTKYFESTICLQQDYDFLCHWQLTGIIVQNADFSLVELYFAPNYILCQ
jgi:hypothetical protein